MTFTAPTPKDWRHVADDQIERIAAGHPLTGHGSWYLTVELPTGPTGARRRLRRGGYRTRAEAQRALTGLRRPLAADAHRVLLTTGQGLAHWLATRLRPRPATLRSYHQHIHQHLIPHLGGILLRELPG